MSYQKDDLIFNQIVNCLVEKYEYNIIRFSEQKQDLWLTNKDHKQFPIIRISSISCSSSYFESEYLSKVRSFLETSFGEQPEILIINTNNDSEPFKESGFDQELVNDNIKSPRVMQTFPELESALIKVKDREKEIFNLQNNLRNVQNRKILKQQKAARKVPKFTAGIMIFCVAMYLLVMAVANQLGGGDNAWNGALIITGAYYKTFVVALSEYWRLFTSGFLHFSIMHLLVNMLSLYYLGTMIEKIYTKWQYIIILIASIIVGNLFTLIIMDNTLAAGISGGLYGLMAACIVYTFESQTIKIPAVRSSIFRLIMINLFISLLPGIGFMAHLGGFVAGAFLGFIFIKSARWKVYKPHVTICFVILLVFLGYFGYQSKTVQPLFKDTDRSVVKDLKSFGLDSYADHVEKGLKKLYVE